MSPGLNSFDPKEEDIKFYEYKNMAVLEYMIKKYGGSEINQKHLNAYAVHEGYWIDIHLSKIKFAESDLKLFYSILDTVKIEKKYNKDNYQNT